MTWQQIRSKFPSQWLLVEAMKAHTEGNQRRIEDLEVVRTLESGRAAMDSYAELHHQNPQRELYVLHTDRPELDIEERWWLGIRGVA